MFVNYTQFRPNQTDVVFVIFNNLRNHIKFNTNLQKWKCEMSMKNYRIYDDFLTCPILSIS